MPLSHEAYRALKEIVGEDYITTDPAVLDTYIYQWMGEFHEPLGNKFMPHRPLAVVLPGSVEEVQAVVRLCNRFRIKFKELMDRKLALPYLPEVRVDYWKRGATHERMGPLLGNYHLWLKKVKQAFDPMGWPESYGLVGECVVCSLDHLL